MQKALTAAQDSDYEISVTAMCQAAGISRQAWYHYFDTPAFVRWWTEQFERYFAAQMPRVSAASLGRALGSREKGSHQDAKLLFERFDRGYAPRSRQEVSGADGGPVKTYICVDPEKVTGKADADSGLASDSDDGDA